MSRMLATAVFVGLGFALPAWACAQVAPMPVIPAVKSAHPQAVPVWERDGSRVTVTARGRTTAPAPTAAASLNGRSRSTHASVRVETKHGLTASAGVDALRWTSVVRPCAPGSVACTAIAPSAGLQRGEVGAGFTGHGVKLDLSLGHAQSDSDVAANARDLPLPRVLPAAGGADVAAPLWFRNSASTSLNAHGEVNLAGDTSLNLGASVGRVRFLPGSGVAPNDTIDQTTVSLGVQHGALRGAIVGHVLEPNLPGAALDQNQRWSGIDLGISVRLPWRGELNFGAQNVWTSGRAPLLFGSGAAAPDQGRVPYVQYHQDL